MTTLAAPIWRTSIAYDAAGQPWQHTPPNGWAPPGGSGADWVETTVHDGLGRLTERTAPDSGTAAAVYDDLGRARFEYDPDGAADAPTNPAPGAVAIRYAKYDRLGRLTERGWVAQPAWDQADLQTKANSDWPIDCPSWRERRSYDAGHAAANGEGRLVCVQTLQDDGSVVTETAAYDAFGKLATCATKVPGGPAGAVADRYDRAGRLLATTQPGLTGADPLTLTRSYDPWGRCATVAGPGGTLADYAWHPDGQPARARLGAGLIDNRFAYTSHGALATIAGNGFAQTLYYSNPPAGADGTPIAPPRRNGLVSARAERLGGGAALTQGYGWDALGQLVSVVDPAAGALASVYDANGNLLAQGTRTFGYQPASNRLVGADARPGAWTYSPAGRLLASPEWTFGYDFATGLVTRIAAADGSRCLDLLYGSTAQRLVKTWRDGTGTSRRGYLPGGDGLAAVEVWQPAGGGARASHHLAGPLGRFAVWGQGADGTAAPVYLLTDHQRSVRAWVDQNGVLERHGYAPFGAAANDSAAGGQATYRFTGQEWDAETALYNYRRRLYDPDVQRFLGPDPRGQYHSPYLYVANNPLQWRDPDGEWATWAGALASVGMVVVGVAVIAATDGMARKPAEALIGAGVDSGIYTAKARGDGNWGGFGHAAGEGALSASSVMLGSALGASGKGAQALVGAATDSVIYGVKHRHDASWHGLAHAAGEGALSAFLVSLGVDTGESIYDEHAQHRAAPYSRQGSVGGDPGRGEDLADLPGLRQAPPGPGAAAGEAPGRRASWSAPQRPEAPSPLERAQRTRSWSG